MSGQTNLEGGDSVDRLKKFLADIDRYIECIGYTPQGYLEEFSTAARLSSDSLSKLTREECLDLSYILCSYVNYIQEQVNKSKIVANWCNHQLMIIMAEHEFDKWTKHESKLSIIITANVFAKKIDNMRQIAEARILKLDGVVYQIKKQADILLEKGRR